MPGAPFSFGAIFVRSDHPASSRETPGRAGQITDPQTGGRLFGKPHRVCRSAAKNFGTARPFSCWSGMTEIVDFIHGLPNALVNTVIAVVALLVALVIDGASKRIVVRLARRTPGQFDDIFVEAARRPMKWIIIAITLTISRRWMELSRVDEALSSLIAGLIVPLLLGWLLIALINAVQGAVEASADVTVADNLNARRRRTRIGILSRIASITVGFLTVSLMLLSIPAIRTVGVSLVASAGLAALAVGAAAQPALKTLIAGIQMAFTEPIRIDDAVVVNGEFGRIEEIALTYVVVRVWDDRRLIVPVTKFMEETFENWTRTGSAITGTAFLYLDPAADIGRLRARFEEIVKADSLWDGRGLGLAVTDMKADAIEVRALVTALNSGDSFDLRTHIREGLLAFIRDEMPEALPQGRVKSNMPVSPETAVATGAA